MIKEIFDIAYGLRTPDDDCRNCDSFTCQDTCEPGKTNKHGENLLLFPGEFEYIAERIGEEPKWQRHSGYGVGMVPPGEACPYWVEGKCAIFENRPIRCRSYPLLASREDENTLRIYSSLQCPKAAATVGASLYNDHYQAWFSVWKSLASIITDERWWTSFKQIIPGGSIHLFDYVGPGVSEYADSTLRASADPECKICEGTGKADDGPCSCATEYIKQENDNGTISDNK